MRGLQTHREKVAVATPGRRLAVNVVGWEVSDIRRGDLLAHPDTYAPTRILDVTLDLLASAPRPLRHHQSVEFFSGAAHAPARVRLIGSSELGPGGTTFAQIRLDVEAR